ncbi:MAG: (d)CMP kinase [Myxococcota bacterium]|nr:(d)CMP kinase [Myxococcota bacterium]
MRKRPVIAIDGPSGVGKSTVARLVAYALNARYIDTGAIYRSLGWLAEREGVSFDDGSGLAALCALHEFAFDAGGHISVDGEMPGLAIRTPAASLWASKVSRHKEVRAALLELQRQLGADGGVVLEGRDIGTVVFPDAEVKIFLTADPKVRAKRRWKELLERGEKAALEDVEQDQLARDEADRNRPISPLRMATDAFELRCDHLTAEQVSSLIIERAQKLSS